MGLAKAGDRPQINLYVFDSEDSAEAPVSRDHFTAPAAYAGWDFSANTPADRSDYDSEQEPLHNPTLVEVLNEYGVEEWRSIDGIGPALANRIVEYRRSNGPFESLDDLLAVAGIGPAKLSQIESHLRQQWGW